MCTEGCRIYRLYLACPVAGCGSGQVSVDKAVDVAVHDCVDVGGLKRGTGVLGEGVGHEDVRTDLAAPFDLLLVALDVRDLVQVLTLLDLDQLGTQHLHTVVLVLELRTLGLAGNNDAGRLMDESNRRRGLVDVLTACTGRTEYLHLDVGGVDLDVL